MWEKRYSWYVLSSYSGVTLIPIIYRTFLSTHIHTHSFIHSSQVGVPGAMQSSQRAINRVNEAKQGGLGKEGWDVLNNVQNGKNRY